MPRRAPVARDFQGEFVHRKPGIRKRAVGVIAITAGAALISCHPAKRDTGAPVPATLPNTPVTMSAAQGARAIADTARVPLPAAWPLTGIHNTADAPHAMIASNSTLASEAGLEILRAGGNAVDAAVATGFALAVTYPEAGNLGGGGYMLIRLSDGRSFALDYREIAPLASTRNMFLDAKGQATDKSQVGHLASGVPGSVAGLTEALARYGTMPLDKVMGPAIRLADSGFTVDHAFEESIRGNAERIAPFAGAAVLMPNGHPLAAGTMFRQPALASTLRAIAANGAAGFYTGPVADAIAAEMRRGGGIISKDDLARYAPLWHSPLSGTYRGYTLLTMPPSSSGGITVLETLNILEQFRPTRAGSALSYHLMTEALRRAFIDRNTKLGDPAFVRVPVTRLTSKPYAHERAVSIDLQHASKTGAFGGTTSEGVNTTHYSVVDEHGNSVATTTTLNDLYGSGVYVPAAGFFLNDEMDDFTVEPGQPNMFGLVQGEQNAIAPGKRMLSAMSPTIVIDPKGQLLMVIGSRGGPRIITSVAQVIVNVIDHHMTYADAMADPRIHHQAWPDVLHYEPNGLSFATVDTLRAMGHRIEAATFAPGGYVGRVIMVGRVDAGWEGVVDPRTGGGAAGY
jgi:gamma-glutamyltranspeptidase / glutathione hydrolase